jgi:tight adherence protein C
MASTDLVMIAVLGGIAAALVLYSLWPNKREKQDRVQRRSAGLAAQRDSEQLKEKARRRAVAPRILEKAAPLLSRPVMPKNASEQSTLRAKLVSAGYRRESALMIFLASKTIGGLSLAGVGLAYAMLLEKATHDTIFYSIFGLGVGFMLPNLWLSAKVRKRSEAIRHGLPDSLDLMVVGVEAGLGLDAALLRVSDEMNTVHPALAEELQITMIETQMGVPRSEALTKMADRSAVAEMRALVAVIVQAEKLGTSIAKALRNQAESLRTKRRQAAEERAQKTAVKLLFPLICFIFKAIFVVLAGPAAIHLMHTFSDLKR